MFFHIFYSIFSLFMACKRLLTYYFISCNPNFSVISPRITYSQLGKLQYFFEHDPKKTLSKLQNIVNLPILLRYHGKYVRITNDGDMICDMKKVILLTDHFDLNII